ncbi:MAG: hypothetical protein UT50_C0022G0002 [Candidatus Moranbacteria bacterium GW2011_GWA2_39_41]|nr:MAG: hypothetical protein UT50_C0022G0002 [Candidatus Moranbacteria bacterium GW2011_GWA2_39_41]
MNITEKIEQIRQKPEHIRLRYVWLSVFVSMFLVLTVWYFSAKTQMVQLNGAPSNTAITQDLGTAVDQFSQQGASIKDAVDNTRQSLSNDQFKNSQN